MLHKIFLILSNIIITEKIYVSNNLNPGIIVRGVPRRGYLSGTASQNNAGKH